MDYHITFWNLENLFDIEHSPRRTEKLQRAIGSDVKGWGPTELNQKLEQLNRIIIQLNAGNGPDILGVCEVENAHVLHLLIQKMGVLNRNYALVHDDSDDKRGIDVAFIYDADVFTVEEENGEPKVYDHFVLRRTATRDILQVNFLTNHSQGQQRLVLIANHWPSRSGGQYESSGYRQIAGETLSYFHQRIREVHGDDTPVLAMGDFNDEPFNESLTRFALALRSRARVVRGRIPYFLNLMWPLMDYGTASFYFGNQPNMLDQFLANENMLKSNSPIKIIPDSVSIERFAEMIKPGAYGIPKHFGGMGKKILLDGYSDHYPISVKLKES